MSLRTMTMCLQFLVITFTPLSAWAIGGVVHRDGVAPVLRAVAPDEIREGIVLRIDADNTPLTRSGLETYYQHVVLVIKSEKSIQLLTRTLSESEQDQIYAGKVNFPTLNAGGKQIVWDVILDNGFYRLNRPRMDGRGDILTRARLYLYEAGTPNEPCVESFRY